jgi:hypothetical protein
MKRLITLLALVSACVVAWGQAPGDPVTPSTASDPMNAIVRPAPQQLETGNPSTGQYDVLVNAYIAPYAKVTVYDNWILFGGLGAGTYPNEGVLGLDPTKGTTASAVDYATGNPTSVTFVPGLVPVTSPANIHDLAGLKIDTNSRLNMVVDMGGWLTRVNDQGAAFAGVDTRKTTGSYQLKNQFKVKFRGKFLDGISDPADDSAGTVFASPTSLENTAYSTWTGWDIASDVIDTDNGWKFPVATNTPDAWTGVGTPADSGIGGFNLVVERGQSDNTWSGTTGNTAAQMWFAQRIMRRGLQDVSGNYRQDISIYLTYREAPVSWTPQHNN